MKRFLLLTLALMVTTGLALAAPVSFTENFDQAQLGNLAGEWEIIGDDQATAVIVDQSATEAASAPNCLKLSDDSPSGAIDIRKNIGQTQKGSFKFSLKNQRGGDFYAGLFSADAKLVEIGVSGGGNLRWRDPNKQNVDVNKVAADTWHTVEITWDTAQSTFAFTFDGTKYGDFPMIVKAIPEKVNFKIGSTSNGKVGHYAYVDNVEVNAE